MAPDPDRFGASFEAVDFNTLERLAKALGCDPGYLIVKKRK